MIALPCIILGVAIAAIATALLVEDELYPVGGSGAGKRRAEKRAAEAADGASLYLPGALRLDNENGSNKRSACGEHFTGNKQAQPLVRAKHCAAGNHYPAHIDDVKAASL